jgi:hypothetical protein
MDELENIEQHIIDLLYIDGASNVQKGGDVLTAHYPRVTVLHGAELLISLFFWDIFNFPEFDLFNRICKQAYKFFGSGSMHALYSIFQKYSRQQNNDRNVGPMCAAETCMGGFEIPMMQFLRLKSAVINSVSSAKFINLKVSLYKNQTVNVNCY